MPYPRVTSGGPAGFHQRSACRRRLVLLTLLGVILLTVSACSRGAVAIERGWSAPVVEEGLVYVGSRDGVFLVIPSDEISPFRPLELDDEDLIDSLIKWRFPLGEDTSLGAIYSHALVTEDRVYAVLNRDDDGEETGNLYALDKEDGAEAWFVETEGRIFGDPILQAGVLYVADEEGIVYAFGLEDGRVRWQNLVSEQRFWSTPTLVDGTLYIGGMDKRLYAMDAGNGDVQWSFEAGGAITSKPMVIGDVIYVGAFDRKFYAIDRNTGEERWVADGDSWFWNDAVASEDGATVYVGSLGSTFYALDAGNGSELWSFDTGAPVRAAPVIVNTRVYVLSEKGRVVGLDLETGAVRNRAITLEAKVLASPVWAEGRLYIHDEKQNLHVIEAPLK